MNCRAIDLTDFFSLVAKWELRDNGWQLVSITRAKTCVRTV